MRKILPILLIDVPQHAKSLVLIVDDPDALDTVLEELNNPDKSAVESAMEGHIIEQSELIGLYSKK